MAAFYVFINKKTLAGCLNDKFKLVDGDVCNMPIVEEAVAEQAKKMYTCKKKADKSTSKEKKAAKREVKKVAKTSVKENKIVEKTTKKNNARKKVTTSKTKTEKNA